MSRLIAVEGGDGVGKATTARCVARVLADRGERVVTEAFPRYEGPYGAAIRASLRRSDATTSRSLFFERALLFALDRSDFAAGLPDDVVVVADRWTASNAAYLCALTADDEPARWVDDLEYGRLALPRPDLTLHVTTSGGVQAERIATRADADASRATDRFEEDLPLQARVVRAYERFAEEGFGGRWATVVNDGTIADLEARVAAVL
jgi:dTMP kinase